MVASDRFWAKIEVCGPDECWPWLGSLDEKGYGHFWENGKVVKAHRKSWHLATGKLLLKRLHVLHSCDNPGCVNPAHLFQGTNQDNCKDCGAKGRHWTQARPSPKSLLQTLARAREVQRLKRLSQTSPAPTGAA